MCSYGAQKVIHMFFTCHRLELENTMPPLTNANTHYVALLRDKLLPALCHKQPELLECGVTFL